MVFFFSPFHRAKQSLFVVGASFDDFGLKRRQRNVGSFGEDFESFAETHTLTLHHKIENITTQIAGIADPRLFVWIDLEAWRMVVVPRAMAVVDRSTSAQIQLGTNQINHISCLLDTIFSIKIRPVGHQWLRAVP